MISVVIPTYKKKDMLLKNLKHNMPFLKGCDVVIVNDYPGDDLSVDLKKYTNCTLIQNETNLGFAKSMNLGVLHTKGSYIVFLNNDVVLKDDSFKRCITYFEKNPQLFAVGFAQIERNEQIVGKNRIYFKNGFVSHDRSRYLSSGPTAWAEGGACIVDKHIFEKLGGFDRLFSPFYWEDIDLSYRAWKTGYEITYTTMVEVKHEHQSTIGSFFSDNDTKSVAFRNQLIFIWKNVQDIKLLTQHLVLLLPNLIRLSWRLDFTYLSGFFAALSNLSNIRQERKRLARLSKKTDHEILTQFK